MCLKRRKLLEIKTNSFENLCDFMRKHMFGDEVLVDFDAVEGSIKHLRQLWPNYEWAWKGCVINENLDHKRSFDNPY